MSKMATIALAIATEALLMSSTCLPWQGPTGPERSSPDAQWGVHEVNIGPDVNVVHENGTHESRRQ